MSQPYVGEIRMFAGNFAPNGWLFCEGQILPISWYETLFQLIGTTYGGDGQETFAVPDLRGRLPLHMGTGPDGTTLAIGETGGVEEVTLTVSQLPSHTHEPVGAVGPAFSKKPAPGLGFATGRTDVYAPSGALTGPDFAIGEAGGGRPHSNIQPYLCVNFIISLYGIFPTQT